ncbi:MAG: hypothetical protein JXR97_12295 [Planctomycetes bacterium]|nr:hypothetical protein [Planctomycetota bacterium]
MSGVLKILSDANRGRALRKIEENLLECLGATKHTGGKSTVTIKIDMELKESLKDRRGTDMLDITVDSSAKVATVKMGADTMYVDDELHISTRDPSQMTVDDVVKDAGKQLRESMDKKEE